MGISGCRYGRCEPRVRGRVNDRGRHGPAEGRGRAGRRIGGQGRTTSTHTGTIVRGGKPGRTVDSPAVEPIEVVEHIQSLWRNAVGAASRWMRAERGAAASESA